MDPRTQIVKESWNKWSDTWYRKYRTEETIAKVIRNPESVFHPITLALIHEVFPDLRGKRVCVPSSGDNHAVFAFHLMGAVVTSCDISERQLDNSAEIARNQGWDIAFLCDDTMSLSKVNSGAYDLVYTSNGAHIWIHDLRGMYTNIQRILNRNGVYVMYDIHPFMRPFAYDPNELKIAKPYDETGPSGEVPECKWRIQDLMNAMISSGLNIERVEEMYAADGTFWVDDSEEAAGTISAEELERLCDWRVNPLAALPQWLSIRASNGKEGA